MPYHPSGACRLASYLGDLFTVESGDGTLALLPYILTAIAVGVFVAAICFTVWRAWEASFLRRLTESGADAPERGKTLAELGYEKSSLRCRLLRHALRSPASILYRNASSDVCDATRAAFAENDAAATGSDRDDDRAARRARRKMGLRLDVRDDTRFYIPAARAAYVESHAARFTVDDVMGLVYAAVGTGVVWFLLLHLVEPLASFLSR